MAHSHRRSFLLVLCSALFGPSCGGTPGGKGGESDAPEDCEERTWYADEDGDGYGVADVTTEACDPGEGWADNAADCDDTDASRVPDGVWEGDFPQTWEDPIDWDALCAACINEVEGQLWISVGEEADGDLGGARTAAAFACVEHVGGSVSIMTSGTNLDGLERLQTIDGNLAIAGSSLVEVDALAGLSAVGSLYIDAPEGAPDLTGLSGLVATGTFPGDMNLTLGGGSLGFLGALHTLEGTLALSGKPDDLSGLGSLTSVGRDLSLTGLSVVSLEGLAALSAVDGSVSVRDTTLPDLSGMGAIDVGGDVRIEGNVAMTSLAGLESLTGQRGLSVVGNPSLLALAPLTTAHLGDGFYLEDNAALQHVDGLSGVTALPDTSLTIATNPSLRDLDGLSGLTAVRELWLNDNDALVSLDGLSALEAVGGHLSITEHESLVHVDGLAALTEVGGHLSISNNAALSDVDGLAGLTSLGEVDIVSNDALVHVDGLSGLATLGTLIIEDNPSLLHLDGLGNLETAETLRISQNYDLEDISGIGDVIFTELELLSLTEVTALPAFSSPDLNGASIHIEGVYALDTIDAFNGMTSARSIYFGNVDAPVAIGGFSALTRIDRNLHVSESSGLQDISGFGALESIGGSVYIGTNEGAFTDISGLGALTEVSESITIRDNLSLTDISGLGRLETVGIQLDIADNPNLCSSIAESIAAPVSAGSGVDTSGNLDGC